MDENEVVQEAMKEVRAASEEELKQVIEAWYEKTRTDGMKLGAQFICAAVYGAIQKHILKAEKQPSLRDYKRMTDDIIKVISVPLKKQETQQNDSNDDSEHNEQAEEEV